MMGGLAGGVDSTSHVASYVVSGIGFIGGGVILKEGFSIRGLNTAATLWCTAAIGTITALGHDHKKERCDNSFNAQQRPSGTI
jgi:putative Mg2+ transporter-C (MgtC) family protein